jgi:hypothetical protein
MRFGAAESGDFAPFRRTRLKHRPASSQTGFFTDLANWQGPSLGKTNLVEFFEGHMNPSLDFCQPQFFLTLGPSGAAILSC